MKNQNKQIANYATAMNAGLVSLVFSTQFFPIRESWLGGALFAFVGVLAISWAWCNWQKL